MSYAPIKIDREKLTMMGVPFPDLAALDSASKAIGSNMFEGFEPTPKLIQFYLDWKMGRVSDDGFLTKLRETV
jgi:putative transcriptional regulator